MKSFLFKILAIGFSGALIVLAFQNCGSLNDGGGDDGVLASTCNRETGANCEPSTYCIDNPAAPSCNPTSGPTPTPGPKANPKSWVKECINAASTYSGNTEWKDNIEYDADTKMFKVVGYMYNSKHQYFDYNPGSVGDFTRTMTFSLSTLQTTSSGSPNCFYRDFVRSGIHTDWGNVGEKRDFQIQYAFCIAGNKFSLSHRSRNKAQTVSTYTGIPFGSVATPFHCETVFDLQ